MQLEKASLIEFPPPPHSQNSDPEKTKICLGENLKLTHHALEIQTQPTLPGTLALG